MEETLRRYFDDTQRWINAKLVETLAALSIADSRLSDAMAYGLTNGGKRLRPMLVRATAEAFEVPKEKIATAAVAIEMVHSYSLIHDDLPAMDDDDLRRGHPTCHIAFDEATAILAGDALLTAAFELLAADDQLSHSQRISMIQILSQASGARGMVAGQSIDLSSVDQSLTEEQLRTMHSLKTGALIKAAVQLGAVVTPVANDVDTIQRLERYAEKVGLAFQVQDDILDIEGDTAVIGKTQGSDIALNKPTYPALLGLDGAKTLANSLIEEALNALDEITYKADQGSQTVDTRPLRSLANYVVNRSH